MKPWLLIPVALLIGLLLGAVGPRAELRQAKVEADSLRRLAAKNEQEKNRLADVLRFLKVPDAASAASGARRHGAPRSLAATNPPVVAATNLAVPAAETPGEVRVEFSVGSRPPPAARPGPGDRRESLRARIDEAADLWRTRAQIARDSFVADAGLDAQHAAAFDVVVEAMNLRLKERIAAWAGTLAGTNATIAAPETGVRMMNDLTGVLVFTYDELDRRLPAGWRDRAGGETSVMDFIDPSVAEPLIGVEHRLQPRRRNGEPWDDEEEATLP